MMNDLNYPVFLAEFLAKSAVVVALGFAILKAVGKFAPALKHGLWLRVFAASLAIPLLLLVFPRWEILPRLTEASAPVTKPLAAVDSSMIFTSTFTPKGGVIIPAPSKRFKFSWPWILLSVWGIGVVFLIFRSFAASALLRKIERSARHPDSGLLEKFTSLKHSVGTKQPVTLLISPLVESPFTWGLTSPLIALPESAKEFPEADLEMILLHELEHVRRRDAFAVLISRVFLAMNWVNPLAWLAIRETANLREEACDRRVLSSGHASENYAEMLFRQAKTASNPYLQTCATAVAETGTIEKRIQMILNPKSDTPSSAEPSASVFSRLCAALTIGFVVAIGVAGCEKPEAEMIATEAHSTKVDYYIDGKSLTLAELENLVSNSHDDLEVNIVSPEGAGTEQVKNALKKVSELGVAKVNVLVNPPTSKSPQNADIMNKVESIIIPSIEFVDTPLVDALEFLQMKSVELDTIETDSNKKGINIVVSNLPNRTKDTRITLKLVNVPLTEALRYTAAIAQVGIKIEPHAVVITADQAMTIDPKSIENGKELIAKNQAKLDSIILPSVEFHETPLSDALQFLQQRSVELDANEADPSKKGINFVLNAQPTPAKDPFAVGGGFDGGGGAQKGPLDRPITLKLKNVPLSAALKYTCDLTGLSYKVEPHNILIQPIKNSKRPKSKPATDPFGG